MEAEGMSASAESCTRPVILPYGFCAVSTAQARRNERTMRTFQTPVSFVNPIVAGCRDRGAGRCELHTSESRAPGPNPERVEFDIELADIGKSCLNRARGIWVDPVAGVMPQKT